MFLLFLLVIPSLAFAISITPPITRYDFVPNQKSTFEFYVDRSALINVTLEFDERPYLAKYVRLIDSNPGGGPRAVRVVVSLPNELEEPGNNRIYVKATEISTNGGGINALAAIRGVIEVRVPYPGYYFKLELSVPPVNQGGTSYPILRVQNLGTNNVENAYVVFDVYEGDTKIKTMTTAAQAIASSATAEFTSAIPTTDLKPGTYGVVATFYYEAGYQEPKEGVLNVGTKYVDIVSYTPSLEQGKIQKFDVEVESRWNDPITKVYTTILLNGVEARTPTDSLLGWEKKTQSAYVDTANLPFGETPVTLVVHYGDSPTEELLTTKEIMVSIVPATVPQEEKPAGLPTINIQLTPVTILIIIIVILVLFDVGWVFYNRQKKKK